MNACVRSRKRWRAIAGLAVLTTATALAAVTTTVVPRAGASTPPPPPPPAPTQIIVKVDVADGYSISSVTSAFPVTTVAKGSLASRGIYLLAPTAAPYTTDVAKLRALAGQIAKAHGVLYAQTNDPIQLADTHFYGWPYGTPSMVGDDPTQFTDQPAAQQLQLDAAHQQSTGAGVTVAVLDTGADPTVPALAGRLVPGWNYVRDNSDTGDVPMRMSTNTSVGHGTFVSGLIALVAPDAKILPEKVLNSNGVGTIYAAAQAIVDATAAGAKVINLSFGTPVKPQWNLLQDAITQAQNRGVIVVAAAGNDGNDVQHFPAAQPKVLSVGALETASTLTSFSDYGGWVQFAAPGGKIVGPMPGGGYATWAGTSMATPFVAGQAALLASLQPKITLDKVIAAMSHTIVHLTNNPVHFGAVTIGPSLTYAAAHP